jgi:hypothetical protein
MEMTQQYLAGELSLILGELQAVATSAAAVRVVVRLRGQAETTCPAALGGVTVRAVRLADRLCWNALTRGETDAFVREIAICTELWEFGVCAGFLEEGHTRNAMERS